MSTITTINATDQVSASRATINTNFSNLNTDKIEIGGTNGAPARGDLMVGQNASPTWQKLALGTSGQYLKSDGTDVAWATIAASDIGSGVLAVARGGTGVATFGGVNTILYTTAADTLASITTANSGVLVTSGTGTPSIATDIPAAVTIGTAYIYRVGGTDVAVVDGGTGASDAATARTNLGLGNVENVALSTWAGSTNITTLGTVTTGTWSATAIAATKGGTGLSAFTLGDIIYASAANTLAALAGNTTTTKKFLVQTGTGSASAAPAWDTIASGDLPSHSHAASDITSGTLAVARGGTGVATFGGTNTILYTTAADTLSAITTANSGVLVTSGTGVPSIATDIPAAVTIGTAYIYRAGGTDVAVADGGTGLSSVTAYAVICGGTTSTGPLQSIASVGTAGQVLTSNGPGALPTFQPATGAFWTTVPGTPTRVSNTQFTVTDTGNTNNYDKLLSKGVCLKWTDGSAVKQAMIISSSYATNTVTVNIMGDILAATATMSSMKYGAEKARTVNFAIAGTLATGTDLAGHWYAPLDVKVFGADARVATAGTTNTTDFDINDDGVTMFTTKPSIASGATADVDNTADDGIIALEDSKITVDIDTVSTTAPVDAYITLYYTPNLNQYLT